MFKWLRNRARKSAAVDYDEVQRQVDELRARYGGPQPVGTIDTPVLRHRPITPFADPEASHERYIRIDDLTRERQREILNEAIRRLDLDL